MLGILGSYQISDRIFLAIDSRRKGLVSLEEYLVYNDILSHGTVTERNLITFNIIDTNRRGRVNSLEFKEFWSLFMELCSQVLNLQMPQKDDEHISFIFNQLSLGGPEFDFSMFERAKTLNPALFDFLEQPGNYMREFVSLLSQ